MPVARHHASNLLLFPPAHSRQNEADAYAKRIEMEREKIEDLDNHIAETHAKILAQRKKMGGADASHENNELIAKQVRMLENRLDKSLVRFNEALAANKQLRAKIDSMRQERVVFDGIYKKLERELHEKKKEMSAIIEDSNNAYQERDKAQGELKVLKERAENDKAEVSEERSDEAASEASDKGGLLWCGEERSADTFVAVSNVT